MSRVGGVPSVVVMNPTLADPSPGAALIHALAGADRDAARGLLAPDLVFRALLPPLVVELDDRERVLDLLAGWFPPGGVEELEEVGSGTVLDRHRVSYRVRWHDAAGDRFVFEQQAYYDVGDAGITWMHLLCTGHRSLPEKGER